METKYTAGPWRWSDRFQTSDGRPTFSLLGADGFGILSCDGEANSPQNVNSVDAHLIAAAPELYIEAFELIGDLDPENMDRRFDGLRAAVAKAEGR